MSFCSKQRFIPLLLLLLLVSAPSNPAPVQEASFETRDSGGFDGVGKTAPSAHHIPGAHHIVTTRGLCAVGSASLSNYFQTFYALYFFRRPSA